MDDKKVPVNAYTALNLSTFWAAINAKASDIAKLPGRIVKTTGNGRSIEYGHDQHFLMSFKPNANFTIYDHERNLLAFKYVEGNAFSWIERNRFGRPIAHHLLNPFNVTVHKDGRDRYYTAPTDLPGLVIDPTDMVHLSNISYDGLRGLSVLQVARNSLRTALASEKLTERVFANGTNPKLAVSVDKMFVNEEEREKFREGIREKHSGPSGDDVILLQSGAKLQELQMRTVDFELLSARKWATSEICRWVDVPPTRIHHDEESKWNNIEFKQIAYVTDSLLPDIVQLQQEISSKIFRTNELGLYMYEKDLQKLLEADKKAAAEYWRVMANFGLMLPDEIRERMGLNPLPNGLGKIAYIQSNMAAMQYVADNTLNRPSKEGSSTQNENNNNGTAKEYNGKFQEVWPS